MGGGVAGRAIVGGADGVMVRSIGAAVVGAVRVGGGAVKVLEPRLPDDVPPPRRASAMAGATSRAMAAEAASKREPRADIGFVTLLLKRL